MTDTTAARFGDEDIAMLAAMKPKELDALAFGVIKLDAEATVLAFNQAESELSGFKPETVIGRNFFRDIAPCARTPEFMGRFLEGVKAGRLNATFEYRFDLQRLPSVWVHMASTPDGNYLIIVKRIG